MQKKEQPIITNLSTAFVNDGSGVKEVLVEKQVLHFDGFTVVQDIPTDIRPRIGFHSNRLFASLPVNVATTFSEKQKEKIVGAVWSHDECMEVHKLLCRVLLDGNGGQALAEAKRLVIESYSPGKGHLPGEIVKEIIDILRPVLGHNKVSPVEWHEAGDLAILGDYEARIYRLSSLTVLYRNKKKSVKLKQFQYKDFYKAREEIVEFLVSLNETDKFPSESSN